MNGISHMCIYILYDIMVGYLCYIGVVPVSDRVGQGSHVAIETIEKFIWGYLPWDEVSGMDCDGVCCAGMCIACGICVSHMAYGIWHNTS